MAFSASSIGCLRQNSRQHWCALQKKERNWLDCWHKTPSETLLLVFESSYLTLKIWRNSSTAVQIVRYLMHARTAQDYAETAKEEGYVWRLHRMMEPFVVGSLQMSGHCYLARASGADHIVGHHDNGRQLGWLTTAVFIQRTPKIVREDGQA
jgi:hypothetical protein